MVALSNTSARQFKIPGWFTLPLLIGILVVGFWLIATFLAPYMTPYDPLQMADRRLQIPSWSHWLGTDALGRDVLARTLYGARHSLPIALVVVVSAVIIGALAGAVAGYRGGWNASMSRRPLPPVPAAGAFFSSIFSRFAGPLY
ncbi:hypothetical protein V568_200242 [Brucella ceti TE28753-12]|nr:hypothetical protein V568_200242 [Brucella ceti TE28753-12]